MKKTTYISTLVAAVLLSASAVPAKPVSVASAAPDTSAPSLDLELLSEVREGIPIITENRKLTRDILGGIVGLLEAEQREGGSFLSPQQVESIFYTSDCSMFRVQTQCGVVLVVENISTDDSAVANWFQRTVKAPGENLKTLTMAPDFKVPVSGAARRMVTPEYTIVLGALVREALQPAGGRVYHIYHPSPEVLRDIHIELEG